MTQANANAHSVPNISRLVIGAPQGRCGKTTVTLGLLRAFKRRGLVVQPYKKGPDYIDPSWHTASAGRQARNLDSFLMSREAICHSLAVHSADADISLIEGAMGLHDGLDINGSASTAEIAKITKSPVILVLDSTRITRTTAAIVLGCQLLDPELHIAGVILNKIARARHEQMATQAIEKYCNIPVVGSIPKDKNIIIPDRHLGLVTNGEMAETDFFLDHLADIICENVNLNQMLDIAKGVPDLPDTMINNGTVYQKNEVINIMQNRKTAKNTRIGVIKDKAFSFYYPENIEALESLGAEIVTLSALSDGHLPNDIDALYIGGGFPEVFAEELENNITLREEIRQAAENDLPVYAECGGLMFLGRSIIVGDDKYKMVGLLPLDTMLGKKPQGHGYTIMEVTDHNLWYKQKRVVGHEFHNSSVVNLERDKITFGFKVERGHGIDGCYDGVCYKNVFASYNHIHAIATPDWASQMIDLAQQYKQKRNIALTGS